MTAVSPTTLALINRPLQTSVVVPQNQSNQSNQGYQATVPAIIAILSLQPKKVVFNKEVKTASKKAELLNRKEDFILNALNYGLQLRPKELSMMTPFSLKIASKH
jgi:uracil DNA glycosylase